MPTIDTRHANEQGVARRGWRFRGCALGCLFVMLLFAVGLWGAWHFLRRHYAGAVSRMGEQGYTTIKGQFVEVNEPLTNRTVIFAQSVRLANGSERGIAIVAQYARISGAVKGNAYFFGQLLVVEPDAELVHNLHVVAQRVELQGSLRGELRGYFAELLRPLHRGHFASGSDIHY